MKSGQLRIRSSTLGLLEPRIKLGVQRSPRSPNTHLTAASLLDPSTPKEERFKPVLGLSRTEFRIFLLSGAGMSSRQISDYDNTKIAQSTVMTHLYRIRLKTGLRNHWELVSYASAYRESGLRREVNAHSTPYCWATTVKSGQNG